MNAYESGNAAYFATPPVNLIYAFHASLSQITKQAPSLEERFRLHREASQLMKTAAAELGLKQLPISDAVAANGMTALWFPEGIVATDLLPPLAKKDIIVAAGLHKDYKREFTHGLLRGSRDRGSLALTVASDCSEVLPYRVCLPLFSPLLVSVLLELDVRRLTCRSCIPRHMGISATDKQRADVNKVVAALKESLAEAKASKNA